MTSVSGNTVDRQVETLFTETMTTPNLTKLCNEPHALGTSHDIAVVLGVKEAPATRPDGAIILTNAQARRLLALAIKAVS